MHLPSEISEAVNEIFAEYKSAAMEHGDFCHPHEGYAVILEELDELWKVIKAKGSRQDMRKEAKQIAAMALRFILDLCEE